MVESFEQTYLVNNLDNQYGYKLSQDTTSVSQLLRDSSSPTTTMTPITCTNPSVDSNIDNTIFPLTSSIRNIGGCNGSINFQRSMETMDKIEEMIQHPSFFQLLTSGTSSDVSDGTQQQRVQLLQQQQQQQQYPTLIPPSTIPAANNARYNSTPSHQQPIIPNHYDFARHPTIYHSCNNDNFGQDPRKSSTVATTPVYNDSRIIDNQNDADTTCIPWLNNSNSSSVHSEYINTAIYPDTSSHHRPDHHYYHPHHHHTTTTTTGSSNDSLPSTTTTEYLPSPPSFSTNEKHLSHFSIYQDEEYFASSSSSSSSGSNNHPILAMSPPSKRARPSPLLMSRNVSSNSFDCDLQHHLLIHHDYMEQEEAQPRFSNEGNGGSLKISDDLVPPLQMHRDHQNDQFKQQQQQRRSCKYHNQRISSSSPSSWQPSQQRSRTKKHGHTVVHSGTKTSSVVRNKTSTTTNHTPLSEASQSPSQEQQQQQQPPSLSSPNNNNNSNNNKNNNTSTEHNVYDRPHQCVQCNRGFNRQQDLKRHLNSVHEKQFIHNCTVCHRSFSRRDSLLRHQKKCRTEVSFSTSLNADNNSVNSDNMSNNNDYNNSISSDNLHHQDTTQQQQQQHHHHHHHSLLYN